MDAPLHIALTNGSRPFDGKTLHLSDLIPLKDLQALLAIVVDELTAENPNAALLRHEDWHEHDGYLTSSSQSTWADLIALTSSEYSLYEQRPQDDFVQIGVYDATGTFYLRIRVVEEDDDPEQYPGRWGSFDVSAPEPLLLKLKTSLHCDRLTVSEAKSYFQERSAA